MKEYQVTRDVKLRVDALGHVSIVQMDPVIQPAIVVGTINLSVSGADKLLKSLSEGLLEYGASERMRRMSA